MITAEQLPHALKAIQRLIIHAKDQAYRSADHKLAELLNDMELLPEFLADVPDRTEDFVEMLQGILHMNPSCAYIVDEFQAAVRQPEEISPIAR